jgi:hypothetical protein
MENLMNQLFYVSSARNDLSYEDILHIVEKAREYNSAQEITGVLLYKGGIFLQLLEGEKSALRKVFEEKIKPDAKHSNIIEIFDLPAKERLFQDWSMGFCEMSEMDMKMINEILSWNKLISAAKEIDNHLILRMLERFKTQGSLR